MNCADSSFEAHHLNLLVYGLVVPPEVPQHAGGEVCTSGGRCELLKADFTHRGTVFFNLTLCVFRISKVIP